VKFGSTFTVLSEELEPDYGTNEIQVPSSQADSVEKENMKMEPNPPWNSG
jgi:hypothetical protein